MAAEATASGATGAGGASGGAAGPSADGVVPPPPPETWDAVVEGNYVDLTEWGGRAHFLSWGWRGVADDTQGLPEGSMPLSVPEGSKGLALLVHGIGDFSYRFSLLGPALAREGYAVLAPDLPGRGRSALPPRSSHTADAYCDFLSSFLKGVGLGAGPPMALLLGHSMGGGVVAAFTEAYPERVAKLALLAPVGFIPAGPIPCLRCLCCCWRGCCRSCLRPIWEGGGEQAWKDDFATGEGAAFYAWSVAHQRLVNAQSRGTTDASIGCVMEFPVHQLARTVDNLAATFNKPVMLMWGEMDKVVPYAGCDTWRSKLEAGGTPVSVATYADAAHAFFLEHPKEVEARLLAWLREE